MVMKIIYLVQEFPSNKENCFPQKIYEWVKNRIERQNILLQETRLSGMSREFGLLDKSGSKWGYYKGAKRRL